MLIRERGGAYKREGVLIRERGCLIERGCD